MSDATGGSASSAAAAKRAARADARRHRREQLVFQNQIICHNTSRIHNAEAAVLEIRIREHRINFGGMF